MHLENMGFKKYGEGVQIIILNTWQNNYVTSSKIKGKKIQ